MALKQSLKVGNLIYILGLFISRSEKIGQTSRLGLADYRNANTKDSEMKHCPCLR